MSEAKNKVKAGPSKGSKTDLRKKSETDLRKKSETDLSKESETDLRKKSETDLRKKSETDLSKESETDLSKESETNLRKKSETDLSKESKAKDTDVKGALPVQRTRKAVRFGAEEKEEVDPPPAVRPRRQSMAPPPRRQSMVGTTGFVSQLLEVEEPESEKDDGVKKPIRKQSVAERRASINAVSVDMDYYMEEILKPGKKKSERTKRFPKLISKEKLEEIISFSTMTATGVRESSKWSPAQLFRGDPETKHAISWVGAYIVGKDYWKEKDQDEEGDGKVGYIGDEQRKPWYEIPLKETGKESDFQKKKRESLDKIEAAKEGDFDNFNYDDLRKERLEYIRRETEPLEGLDEEFKLYFQDVCKSSDFLHREHRISMSQLDRWLERAEILDYSRLTLINTGLCFIASGGSRHRGLSFDEFTQFLQMISITTGKSMKELVLRMQACQRAPKKEGESVIKK